MDNFEDYFEGDYDEYSDRATLADVTIDDLNNLINFFEEAINRNNTIVAINEKASLPMYASYGTAEDQLENIRLIKDEVLPKTDEQRVFGQMLGINQGMDTDPYKMYSMIRRIENHINKRVDKFNKDNGNQIDKLIDQFNEANGTNIAKEFNLLEFLKPENAQYREV